MLTSACHQPEERAKTALQRGQRKRHTQPKLLVPSNSLDVHSIRETMEVLGRHRPLMLGYYKY